MAGLYLHIPFCVRKCPYCDFYSVAGQEALQEAYVTQCVKLLEELPEPETGGFRTADTGAVAFSGGSAGQNGGFRTAYIGGGTPSVLPPELLGRLLQALQKRLFPGAECTLECNPSSVSEDLCRIAAAYGVNRVSLGLQSAVAAERKALGRVAAVEGVAQAIRCWRAAGIRNLSLDLMLGIPGQTQASLQESLTFCERQQVQHVSVYLLTIEAGTPFARTPPPELPDDDTQAELYLYACAWLEEHGHLQYEISNFAQPGMECQHNLNYWRCGDYEAFGPGAHGFTGRERWCYERDLLGFLERPRKIFLGTGGDARERAMLGLRLAEGIFCEDFSHAERANLWERDPERLQNMKRLGLLYCKHDRIQCTQTGFLVSNRIIQELIF